MRKDGGYTTDSELRQKLIDLQNDYQMKQDIAQLQTQMQLEQLKAQLGVQDVDVEAKSIIKRLQKNPELLDEFNRQMRTLKLEQLKNSKK